MAKRTPLYNEHVRANGKIVDFAGWEMPVQYSGISDEHHAVRKTAGLFDVSHMGRFEITGKDALTFLNHLTPNDVASLTDNHAQYSLLLNERGTIIDDIIVYRITHDRFFMVVNASNLEKDFAWIKKNLKGDVKLTDRSAEYALIAIQGPAAAKIMSKVISADIDSIGYFHLGMGAIKGGDEVILARTGYTGEDGFEIFVPTKSAASLWQKLMEAGKDDGLKPAGLGCRDTLRLEMKYTLYGHEITEETDALEAGLKWVVKFKKSSDFIGKAALEKIWNAGLKRKAIGFKMIDAGIPRQGFSVKANGRTVGIVTSGTYSPSLEAPIGIAYVESELAEVGSKFFIDIRGKERQAEVVKTPFYTSHVIPAKAGISKS